MAYEQFPPVEGFVAASDGRSVVEEFTIANAYSDLQRTAQNVQTRIERLDKKIAMHRAEIEQATMEMEQLVGIVNMLGSTLGKDGPNYPGGSRR